MARFPPPTAYSSQSPISDLLALMQAQCFLHDSTCLTVSIRDFTPHLEYQLHALDPPGRRSKLHVLVHVVHLYESPLVSIYIIIIIMIIFMHITIT